ncbi:MAG TPA: NUDIX domain-containing protein [Terriglobia bacterium]|nr:NUDIX domain-containing protein [Terriglobia bacterium]
MAKVSAGLLLFRYRDGRLQVFLVHPGGPFWARKDEGAWSIPKGEVGDGEDPLAAAKREFEEETGIQPSGDFVPLAAIRQKAGKVVQAWAFAGDCDPRQTRSNSFTMEWPARSGKQKEFPEVDRAEFFEIEEAKRKINPAQAALLAELQQKLSE